MFDHIFISSDPGTLCVLDQRTDGYGLLQLLPAFIDHDRQIPERFRYKIFHIFPDIIFCGSSFKRDQYYAASGSGVDDLAL